ncbi:hypothetical protein LOAG_01971 [Loa loa]|uniref:Uncharacterized protein n=1 Tax=Loa loa TaxID=7209 RepID=A0A1S0U9Q3_LOALO|nr:hypothetical protein LOAG_01971 [Loa loa]EFO26515.1 hypothetical protein LOAG_01971 [Loa loa]
MHVLLVPHAFELCTAAIIMLVLMLWPVYICREITDIELEEAYINDKQCALELHEHLELVQNDTIVQILQRFDDGTDNITWLNIQHEYHYQKSSVNSICAMLGFRERFGTANGQLGSAHLLIPIVGAIITIFFLCAHIFEIVTEKDESSLAVQLFCGLICWLIISVSLTIIDFNWNGTNKMLRNLGAPFPLEWKISKYIAWFWACIKIIELLLANCCQNIIIKFDKPISLMIVDLSTDYVFLDENAPPYPNEYNTMDSAVDLM